MSDTPSRTDVRAVRCPECDARPDASCTGARGDRTANHIARIRAWQEQQRASVRERRPYDLTAFDPDALYEAASARIRELEANAPPSVPEQAPAEERERVHEKLRELRATLGWNADQTSP